MYVLSVVDMGATETEGFLRFGNSEPPGARRRPMSMIVNLLSHCIMH